MSKVGSEGWVGSFIHCKALQLVCSQADTPVKARMAQNNVTGHNELKCAALLHRLCKRLHGGSSDLVMFCAEHVLCRTQMIPIFLQVGVCASDLSRDAEGPPGLRPS